MPDADTPKELSPVSDTKTLHPFRVSVGLDQETNTTTVGLKMFGLQLHLDL